MTGGLVDYLCQLARLAIYVPVHLAPWPDNSGEPLPSLLTLSGYDVHRSRGYLTSQWSATLHV
jgi:hypothetical protein